MKYAKRSAALLLLLVCAAVFSGCSTGVQNAGYSSASGQLIISEVMSSNDVFIPAVNGCYYDWVELYNASDSPVQLSDYYLSDDESAPQQFRLGKAVLEPGGYVVIYLSGLDLVDSAGALHAPFKLSSMGETLILCDKQGDVIHQLKIPASQPNISYGLVSENTYEWFAAPSPGAENSGSHSSDPSQLVYENNGVIINEFMTSNVYIHYDHDGDYGDWVELYNTTSVDADMTGYCLTDDPENPGKYRFPDGTTIPAGGYLLVWCDGKNTVDASGALHTGFSLGRDDVSLVLYTKQGVPAHTIELFELPDNISCGYPEGKSELRLFARPTPGAPNVTADFELTSSPVPDVNDGVYISEVLSVSSAITEYSEDFVEIHNATSAAVSMAGYTLSGSVGEPYYQFPDMELAAGGYLVVWFDGSEESNSAGDLHSVKKVSSGGETIYLTDPSGKVCDCFRSGKGAAGKSSGRMENDVTTRCFFDTPTPGRQNSGAYSTMYCTVPQASLVGGWYEAGTKVELTSPAGFEIRYTLDGSVPTEKSARYTEAITIERTTVLRAICVGEGYCPSDCITETYFTEEPHDIAVVSLSGAQADVDNMFYEAVDEEYAVNIEFFEDDGKKAISFGAGACIFGAYTRTMPQKGVKLVLREAYGTSEVTYPFFEECDVSSFSSLLLRPSGQDQNRAKLRDELVPAIVSGCMDIDYQAWRACALYINGQYHGLYYLRERQDGEYLEHHYGFEEGTFDLIKGRGKVQEGSYDEYAALIKFVKENDLSEKENYEYVCSQVDIDSLINFWIVETYFANADSGNIRYYKTENGKWRWMLFDLDWGMSETTWYKDYIYMHLLDPDGHGAEGASMDNSLIRKLLDNEDFRDRFISMYCYHLNTTFQPERTIAILESMAETIESEIIRQDERWRFPTVDKWNQQVEMLKEILTEKPEIAKKQLCKNFGLSEAEINKYLKENQTMPQ